VKAFRIYRIFYGMLLFAFFVVAMTEEWRDIQRHAGTVSPEALAATATINGLLAFLGKAVLSPLGLITLLIFLWLRLVAKPAKANGVDTKRVVKS
jgi:hypothetical protein